MKTVFDTIRPNFAPPDDAGGPPSAAPANPSGGPTSTPSAPASTPATSAPNETTGGLKDVQPEATNLFENMGNVEDLDALIAPEILTAPTITQPATVAPTTPVPVQPAGPTPQPAATQPAVPVQPAQPSPQATEPAGPVDIVKELETNRDALIKGLASEQFQLSPEDIQAFQENPNAVVPMLAAKVYYMSAVNMARQMKSVMTNLPQMFDNFMKVRDGNAKAENAFYSMWPKLDRNNADVNDMVMRTAVAYRNANPNMNASDFHRAVGQMVSAHFKLPLEAVTTQTPVAPAAQASPPASVSVTPVPSAFVPAAPGSATQLPNSQPQPMSPWEAIGQDFE